MTFTESVRTCLTRKYFDFSGRASRSEYWYFWIFQIIVTSVASAIHDSLGTAANIALLGPSLGVSVRRLHDVNRSGWYLLAPGAAALVFIISLAFTSSMLAIVTGLGVFGAFIWVLVLAMFKGTDGPNRYGADPLEAEAMAQPEPLKEQSSVTATEAAGAAAMAAGAAVSASRNAAEGSRIPEAYPPRTRSLGAALGAGSPTAAQAASEQQAITPKPRFCTECGAKVPEGARFCTNCGAKIS